jgi:ComF family protein
MINRILDFLLASFFPTRCIGCGTEGMQVCMKCLGGVKFLDRQRCPHCKKSNISGMFCEKCGGVNYFFDQLLVCVGYRENKLVKKMIFGFKYRFNKGFLPVLGEILRTQLYYYSSVVPALQSAIIVPVPIHKKRRRFRGFNQAGLLAEYLVEFFPEMNVCDCLQRVKYEVAQAKLNRKDRLENLCGAVVLKKDFNLRGKTVILLDDVATTCATLKECSKALKDAGVRYICGLTLARG